MGAHLPRAETTYHLSNNSLFPLGVYPGVTGPRIWPVSGVGDGQPPGPSPPLQLDSNNTLFYINF